MTVATQIFPFVHLIAIQLSISTTQPTLPSIYYKISAYIKTEMNGNSSITNHERESAQALRNLHL